MVSLQIVLTLTSYGNGQNEYGYYSNDRYRHKNTAPSDHDSYFYCKIEPF